MFVVVPETNPNPSRIRLARLRRGLTKVALAPLVGFSAKMLSEYENGHAMPTPAAIDALSSVLKFPPSFFYRADLDEPDRQGVSFRSLASMTTRQQDSVLAAVAMAFELSEWIDHRFELEPVDLPDLRDNDPHQAAMMLRNYWGIGTRPIGNMVHLLESKGVRVFSLTERAKQVDACSLWYRDAPFVFLNTMKTVEHSRMDAAHELGHLVLHRHVGPRGRSVEPEAKAFGSAFLMPEESVSSAVPRMPAPTMEQMVQLKAHWGVSLAALAFRLNRLGILPDWSYRRVCIELSSYGRTREPFPMPERETSAVLARVFSMLRETGTTKADVAKQLDLYTDDLDALIFGLGVLAATEAGQSKADPKAAALRRQFKVYEGSGA